MNMKELAKEIDISWWRILWLRIWDKAELVEYLYERSQNAVNLLMGAYPEQVTAIRERLLDLNSLILKFRDYIPSSLGEKVKPYNAALREIVDATEDMTISEEERQRLVDAATAVYSSLAPALAAEVK